MAAAGVGNTVGMPGLFYHKLRDENNPASEYGVALTPNPANLQWVDSGPVHPEPFGPRDGKGKDVLEEAIRSLSPGTPVFINDWKMFHIRMGEVHCGSAAERQAAGGWWEK